MDHYNQCLGISLHPPVRTEPLPHSFSDPVGGASKRVTHAALLNSCGGGHNEKNWKNFQGVKGSCGWWDDWFCLGWPGLIGYICLVWFVWLVLVGFRQVSQYVPHLFASTSGLSHTCLHFVCGFGWLVGWLFQHWIGWFWLVLSSITFRCFTEIHSFGGFGLINVVVWNMWAPCSVPREETDLPFWWMKRHRTADRGPMANKSHDRVIGGDPVGWSSVADFRRSKERLRP